MTEQNPLYQLPIYEPFVPDDKMVKEFQSLMPSVFMIAASLIPGAERGLKFIQGYLNKSYPESISPQT